MRDASFSARGLLRQFCLIACVTSAATMHASALTGTWSAKAPMPTARFGAGAAVVDGILYVIGGYRILAGSTEALVEAYDPETNTWTVKAPMITPRAHMAVGVVDGIVYVAGGWFEDAYGGRVLSSVEAYDPKTDSWTNRAAMPTPRSGTGAAAINGVLYVAGGTGSGPNLEVYNSQTDTWASMTPMPTPRWDLAVIEVDGVLYAMGGAQNAGQAPDLPLATNEAYMPTTNTWKTVAPMPTPRYGLIAAVVNGIAYAIGGVGASGPSGFIGTVEAYEPKTNTWSSVAPMPLARASLAGGAVGDTLYAVGGVGEMRSILASNEAFSPFLHAGIDIKPGDARNVINLNSAGTVPVAILGSATFDPMSVDPSTVTLAGAPVARRGWGVPMTARGDFNHDGYFDLLLHFRTQDLELTPTSTEAVLYATTFSGQRIRGADSVRLILPPGGGHSSTQAAKARKSREP